MSQRISFRSLYKLFIWWLFWAILRVKLICSSRDEEMRMLETAEPTCKALWQVLAIYRVTMIDLLICLYFITLAGIQWHCLSVFPSLKTQSKEWSQHVTKDILQVFVQAVHLVVVLSDSPSQIDMFFSWWRNADAGNGRANMQGALTSLSHLPYYCDRSIDLFLFHNIGRDTMALLISFPIFENPIEGMVTTCHKGYPSGLCTSCSSGFSILGPKK